MRVRLANNLGRGLLGLTLLLSTACGLPFDTDQSAVETESGKAKLRLFQEANEGAPVVVAFGYERYLLNVDAYGGGTIMAFSSPEYDDLAVFCHSFVGDETDCGDDGIKVPTVHGIEILDVTTDQTGVSNSDLAAAMRSARWYRFRPDP